MLFPLHFRISHSCLYSLVLKCLTCLHTVVSALDVKCSKRNGEWRIRCDHNLMPVTMLLLQATICSCVSPPSIYDLLELVAIILYIFDSSHIWNYRKDFFVFSNKKHKKFVAYRPVNQFPLFLCG